jgi:hypothetical protein
MTSSDRPTPLRRAIKTLRDAIAPLWCELKRLNSMGVRGGSSRAGRTMRSAAFRSALSQKYRDRSPCC